MESVMLANAAKLLIAALLVAGCYEGWEYERDGKGDGETPTGLPSTKPLYAVLFEPIVMSSSAIQSARCFPEIGLREYRQAEWSQRQAAAFRVVVESAERPYVVQRDIASSDCNSLAALIGAASNPSTWPDGVPPPDPLDRISLHVRFVMWQNDPSGTPPGVVTAPHWAVMAEFRESGRKGDSGLYQIVSGTGRGYFAAWAATQNNPLLATPIQTVDPTPVGIAARSATIAADSEAFRSWLLGFAR
jgi:hypothetical protein